MKKHQHKRTQVQRRTTLARKLVTKLRTSQLTPPAPTPLPPALALASLGLSQASITPSEQQALLTPFPDDQLELKPSGEVYCSHQAVRARLNQIFGPGAWGMLPEDPKEHAGSVIQKWTLMVRGRPMAVAYGEARYIETNPRHSWGNALESAKSNALTRAAKDLGMALLCWDRRWQFRYRMAHGVLVQVRGKHGTESQWRHLDSPPLPNEFGVDPHSPNAERYHPPTAARRAAGASWRPTTDDEQPLVGAPETKAAQLIPYGDAPIGAEGHRALRGAMRTFQRSEAEVHSFIQRHWGYTSTKQIQQSQLPTLVSWVREPYDLDRTELNVEGTEG